MWLALSIEGLSSRSCSQCGQDLQHNTQLQYKAVHHIIMYETVLLDDTVAAVEMLDYLHPNTFILTYIVHINVYIY